MFVTNLLCVVLFNPVEHATAVFSALPQLFQSPAMAPKKTRTPSEVFFHILTVRQRVLVLEESFEKYVMFRKWLVYSCFYY